MGETTYGTVEVLACPPAHARAVAEVIADYLWALGIEETAELLRALKLGESYGGEMSVGAASMIAEGLAGLGDVVAVVTEDPKYEYDGETIYVHNGETDAYASNGEGSLIVRATDLLAAVESFEDVSGDRAVLGTEARAAGLLVRLRLLAGETAVVAQVEAARAALQPGTVLDAGPGTDDGEAVAAYFCEPVDGAGEAPARTMGAQQ